MSPTLRRKFFIMAIWQFDLFFVPRAGRMPLRTNDGYEVPALSEPTALEAHAYLSQHMGQPWPMLEDWLVFGDEKSNRVDFLRTKSGGTELLARIDARCNDDSFCNTICQLAERLNCILFIAESELPLEPVPTALALALRNSRASKFVADPKEFLRGVRGTN